MGGKDATGSTKDRLRVGELITWGPWGVALSIVRVLDPLPTHYEWVMRQHYSNYAGVRAMLHYYPETGESFFRSTLPFIVRCALQLKTLVAAAEVRSFIPKSSTSM